MQHKDLLKLFQSGMLTAAMVIGFAPLTHAADARAESTGPSAQPESNQPQQQASPAKPAAPTSPDDDEDEETALA